MNEPFSPADHKDLARIAALDIGDARIGVAISDPLGYTAQPLFTYTRMGNNRRDAKSLLRLLRKEGCRSIIVGNPLYLSGVLSPSAKKAHAFVELLRTQTDLPIQLWDERLSTTEAHELLDLAGHKREGRRDKIDQVAAVIILQSYMQAQRPSELPPEI
jgi:putative Holliday junction resolvase